MRYQVKQNGKIFDNFKLSNDMIKEAPEYLEMFLNDIIKEFKTFPDAEIKLKVKIAGETIETIIKK